MVKPIWEWHRITNDANGNPRYVVHFLPLVADLSGEVNISARYRVACKRANTLGGRKFHNKQFGGGIVFQAYDCELPRIERGLLQLQGRDGK